ncbi:hypothetical protein EDO6_01117 [Paenibacillus xylanexedens]|nr:hypothetical protein EDO6_01117 [Paenibacillus xylanexedens]
MELFYYFSPDIPGSCHTSNALFGLFIYWSIAYIEKKKTVPLGTVFGLIAFAFY